MADRDRTTARKGKTMTKHMTGDSEVEHDLRKMKTAPQALNVLGVKTSLEGLIGKVWPVQHIKQLPPETSLMRSVRGVV